MTDTPDFSKLDGLIAAVVQDARTSKILMLGYMNQEAYEKTIAEKIVTFYSRSKKRLWTKGETSGNFLHVVEAKLDCDNDALLIKAIPHGPTCHTGADTCWFESNSIKEEHAKGREDSVQFLVHLEEIIRRRRLQPNENSYTSGLFKKGINKIAQKVGEEAVELVIEAKDANETLFLGEAADLLFHYLVLLQAKGYALDDVIRILKERHK